MSDETPFVEDNFDMTGHDMATAIIRAGKIKIAGNATLQSWKDDPDRTVIEGSAIVEPTYSASHILTPGFGIVKDGKLLIRTVSNSPRAAMVNALALIFDLWAQGDVPDIEIRRAFEQETAGKEIYLVRVEARASWPPIVLAPDEDISITSDGDSDKERIEL